MNLNPQSPIYKAARLRQAHLGKNYGGETTSVSQQSWQEE